MERKTSRRAQELQARLTEKFQLSPALVDQGIQAIASCIQGRLPVATQVSLFSWLPFGWEALTTSSPGTREMTRGVEALRERLVEAGVPEDIAVPFAAELLAFIGERCGRPLADSIRRRVPELAAAQLLSSKVEVGAASH